VGYTGEVTRLTLLRHAKSSWDDPELRDIQRPLNPRGLRDAPFMGAYCADRLSQPDLVLVSPARRAQETVELFLEGWRTRIESDGGRWRTPEIAVLDELYLAGSRDWDAVLDQFGRQGDHILACGHQPGIGDFAREFDPRFRGDFPTAAVVSFSVDDGSPEIDFVERPKDARRREEASS